MCINTPNVRACNVIFFFSLGVETENNAECQWAVSVKGINAFRKPWPPTLLSGARQSTVHFHRNVSATAGAKLFFKHLFPELDCSKPSASSLLCLPTQNKSFLQCHCNK